jgi:hypothetical protein
MPSHYRTARLADIEPVRGHDIEIDGDWRPVRHHLGIEPFGINAYTGGSAGDVVIEEHTEDDYGHHELYLVVDGHAHFHVGDEAVDAPAGTFVYYADPSLRRRAVAVVPGTTIVAVGAKPGEAFSPSAWEIERTAGLPQAR